MSRRLYSHGGRHNKKKCAVHSSLKDLHKSPFFLVIKKIFLNQNLCAPPYDHHVFYTKFATESVKGVGEVEDAIIDVIYTHKNLSSVAFFLLRKTLV